MITSVAYIVLAVANFGFGFVSGYNGCVLGPIDPNATQNDTLRRNILRTKMFTTLVAGISCCCMFAYELHQGLWWVFAVMFVNMSFAIASGCVTSVISSCVTSLCYSEKKSVPQKPLKILSWTPLGIGLFTAAASGAVLLSGLHYFYWMRGSVYAVYALYIAGLLGLLISYGNRTRHNLNRMLDSNRASSLSAGQLASLRTTKKHLCWNIVACVLGVVIYTSLSVRYFLLASGNAQVPSNGLNIVMIVLLSVYLVTCASIIIIWLPRSKKSKSADNENRSQARKTANSLESTQSPIIQANH